ncbi:MAG: bifunctional folylpolyglutamate synthase/dihydrofolate synthase [Oscillospiraceae bacterium]|nr:bifunctional folylpolyglutamate synthase/dihydrofolate synthase [Oscillospiraceae bacterium]MDD4368941.1 bifunctional folylpolyglutamate synthase/dihydrofolate synthase [Oscillospiraceae bacterium]
MSMTYEAVLEDINRSWRFGSKLGLSRMQALMERLGNPQAGLSYIHVAGTNGKGSTVTYLATILALSGRRVGTYTSPYMERFTDRIRILDGPAAVLRRREDPAEGEISQAAVARLYSQVSQAVTEMLAAGQEHATQFEMITAMAFLYYREQKCDTVVLEVGLGGRLDATNIITCPEVAVITALGYDHMKQLGNTMWEIAAEKAAIIKEGCRRAFLYDPDQASATAGDSFAVRQVIWDRCEQEKVALTVVSAADVHLLEREWGQQVFSLYGYPETFVTHLNGNYQLLNAALAVKAAVAYAPELTTSRAVYDGIQMARWPGRMDILSRRPLFVADGAHNPQAAAALRQTLTELSRAVPVVFILAVMKDKAYAQMLSLLLTDTPYQVAAVICTTPEQNPRALPPPILAEAAAAALGPEAVAPVAIADLAEAIQTGLDLAQHCGAMLLAAGSLYLVSDIKLRYDKMIAAKNA